MKKKVQTFFLTTVILFLALLSGVAGYDSYARPGFSTPAVFQDSLSSATDQTKLSPQVRENIVSSPTDSVISDGIGYHITDFAADTSDTVAVGQEINIVIGGDEGWRMMATPTPRTTFSELLEPVWTQGLSGSDDPIATVSSVLDWSETSAGFTQKPSAMSDYIEPGRGFITYFFEDDNPAEQNIQGGFPKELTLKRQHVQNNVSVEVTATDRNENNQIDSGEGWNLVGNPFDQALSVEAVLRAFQAAGDSLNRHVYVWNRAMGNGNGGFEALGEREEIAPFQAFFVKYMGEEEIKAAVELRKEELLSKENSQIFRQEHQEFSLTLQASNGEISDEYEIEFSDRGSILPNRLDAFKLHSIKQRSLHLYGRKGRSQIQVNQLPAELSYSIEIPIGLEHPDDEELVINWKNLKDLPHQWTLTLIDRERGIETDLRTNRYYRFAHSTQSDQQQVIPSPVERPQIIRENGEQPDTRERFVLAISPGAGKLAGQQDPETIKLKPNYPNPFNRETIISYELNQDAEVTLSIWNMIGQKVATLVDDQMEAGPHEVPWIASQMPSGMYIARLEVGNQVFTRKMTLIK